MSFVLPDSIGLTTAREYVVGVHASLKALESANPELNATVEAWSNARARVDALLAKATAISDELAVRRALEQLADYGWDGALGEVSSESFHVSGKDPAAKPYSELFGTVKASDAQHFGAAKATVFGKRVLARLEQLADSRLSSQTQKLAQANDTLAAAYAARTEAEEARARIGIEKRQLVAGLEALIASAEVALLTQFPGRRELVRAVLSPARLRRAPSQQRQDDSENLTD
jgi:hypothetical protein